MSGRASPDCVLNDMSGTLQGHKREKKTSLSDIWSMLSQPGDAFMCGRTHVPPSLRSVCTCSYDYKSQGQIWSFYSLMPMMHDALMRTYNEISGGAGV